MGLVDVLKGQPSGQQAQPAEQNLFGQYKLPKNLNELPEADRLKYTEALRALLGPSV